MTCSFDSLIELIVNGYSDYIVYQRCVKAEFSDFEFFHLVTDYALNKTTSKCTLKEHFACLKLLISL